MVEVKNDFHPTWKTIAPHTTQQNWSTIAHGSFAQPEMAASLLLVATGNIENTNMVCDDASKNSVSDKWGQSPSLIEIIPFTLTLPFPSERTTAWRA